MASKYLWLFDNGHGGIIDGEYQTPGKRSPKWSDGTQLFEGEFNRSIVQRLMILCDQNNIEYRDIVPEQEDISRKERIKRANDIYNDDKRCIYLSIHSNVGGGKGWEVFTSRGETRSDKIAQVFFDTVKEQFPETRMRSDSRDGDSDKEAQNFANNVYKHRRAEWVVESHQIIIDNAIEDKTKIKKPLIPLNKGW